MLNIVKSPFLRLTSPSTPQPPSVLEKLWGQLGPGSNGPPGRKLKALDGFQWGLSHLKRVKKGIQNTFSDRKSSQNKHFLRTISSDYDQHLIQQACSFKLICTGDIRIPSPQTFLQP